MRKKIVGAIIFIILMYFTLQWCAISKKNDQLNSSEIEETAKKRRNIKIGLDFYKE